jgi:two-component system NtrC family sensor kinase
LTSLLDRRLSLHRHLAEQTQVNGELELQLEQMQALATIGMVSAMAAHEMNNILTPVSNYARLCIKHPDDKQLVQKAIKKAIVNTENASKILESLLSMANGKQQEKRHHSLRYLVEEVFTCIARDFSKDKIKVIIDIPDDFQVWGERVCLQQVLMNLILNARESMLDGGGQLMISAQESDDCILLTVSDTGCGIESHNLERIFEPFFTMKKRTTFQRSGTGLGLCFCRKVVENHRGTISVESQPQEGTTFKISLPIR